jgi:uncharacterized protein
MYTITLEEHFATPAFMAGPAKEMNEQMKRPGNPMQHVPDQLLDLGEKRIAEMDEAGIDMQVLSINAPGLEQENKETATTLAKETNEVLEQAIAKYPKRFAGFAAIPTMDIQAAITELERTMKLPGFKGAVINGHVNGKYLDDKSFWPILECANKLHAPIYLHPTAPPTPVFDAYYRGFGPAVDNMLARAGWGWHIETAVHIIRMILGGVFDEYPDLQFIIGHMGEALPIMLQRMDKVLSPKLTGLKHSAAYYLRNNVYYTFSGFNYTSNFLTLLMEVGVDRIMFSADYPYSSMKEARAFLDKLPVSDADREKIASGNARRLLRIQD